MANLQCIFKPINGIKTGIVCKYTPSKKGSSPGILYMAKCPDGKSFIVENKDYGNSYYKLIDPPKYGLPKTIRPIYVCIDNSYIKNKINVNEDISQSTDTPQVSEHQKMMYINRSEPLVKIRIMNTNNITRSNKMNLLAVDTAKSIKKNS